MQERGIGRELGGHGVFRLHEADWELQKLGSIAGIKAVVSKHFGYGNLNVRGPLTPRDLEAAGSSATAKLEELIVLEKNL